MKNDEMGDDGRKVPVYSLVLELSDDLDFYT